MRNLVIDIGNTRIKSALFDGENLLEESSFENLEVGLKYWKNLQFDFVLVSSVKQQKEELDQILPFGFLFLDSKTPSPVTNGYASPESLGLDRLAAAVGAWKLAGAGPVMAIDLGTCITYELVDPNGVYLGGAISPGVRMRAKAMHQFTAKLPLLEKIEIAPSAWGDHTKACMQAGIFHGVKGEIEEFIEAYSLKFPEIKVFICGGDAQSFESIAKDHIFVVPNLVLYGLNAILNHNVE